MEVGLVPFQQYTLKPGKGLTEALRALYCRRLYHREGAPHRGLKPPIHSSLANLRQVFTLYGQPISSSTWTSYICSADKVFIFLSFFDHVGHPDLGKMRWNTTQGPNDLNMRLHISSWNSDDLIKVWRESRQNYSLLCLVGYMYYLWCRMNDWLPWILICEANEETLPLCMQCYRKVVSSNLWCGKSWSTAHFICLSYSWKVNSQSWFNSEDLRSSVGQMPLYLTVQYQSYICPVFAD